MTLIERELVVLKAIKHLENKMVILAYCEADCTKSKLAKEAELDQLRLYWQNLRTVLVNLRVEELKVA